MAIELLMGSSILQEPDLDNRDRAMIIMMAGPVLAANIVKQAMEDPDGLQKRHASAATGSSITPAKIRTRC